MRWQKRCLAGGGTARKKKSGRPVLVADVPGPPWPPYWDVCRVCTGAWITRIIGDDHVGSHDQESSGIGRASPHFNLLEVALQKYKDWRAERTQKAWGAGSQGTTREGLPSREVTQLEVGKIFAKPPTRSRKRLGSVSSNPLSDEKIPCQPVRLRDGRTQVWGEVQGNAVQTSPRQSRTMTQQLAWILSHVQTEPCQSPNSGSGRRENSY